MSIASLTDPITPQGGHTSFDNLDHWMQGRTLYGGASALIAYTAAVRAFADLPPLRAGQVAFVAPTGPEVELKREIVRQGRNVAQVRSEIWCEGKCTLSAFWLFGTTREPNATHPAARVSDWPGPPEEAEATMTGKGPAFIQNNFELRKAQDISGRGEPVVRRWARLADREGLDPVSELILLGDVLPPGAMRAMQRQGPISSINWSFNLLDTAPETRDGWWLSENASQHAAGGYSSERLRLWNAEGRQVLDGMQCVAIFG
ncbi:thioesterase family protein [Qipengyuania sp. 1NDH17]|uniref:Thioesterase family protein n=1 Tax=Qipengyuania polymorpha TaxID=2867234 RepID=A0ABS7IXG2_9SPHN|nr:thioesterase family protein [Qipengyuania polymorpha]MBX7458252.1 thioesterase family protein [Qipengyuania polymorpha]